MWVYGVEFKVQGANLNALPVARHHSRAQLRDRLHSGGLSIKPTELSVNQRSFLLTNGAFC